jgi:esterase/lipase/carbon monoxide dehydrogenase subunit G
MIEINEEFTVAAPPAEVYQVLSDPHAVVECVQGAELGETHEDGSFDSSITIKFSALRIKFLGRVTLELEEPERRGTMTATGKDGQGGTKFAVTAEFGVSEGEAPQESLVTIKGEVELRGKLASVIEGAAGAVTQRMTGEFIEALRLRCASGTTEIAAVAQSATVDGGSDGSVPTAPAAAAVLLHDFGGSPNTLRAWGEALAAGGVSVSIPRLPGHGTRWKDLNRTTFDDWCAEAVKALAAAHVDHQAVHVMGLGLGATLALRLAADQPGDVAGVVAVNPVVSGLRGVTSWHTGLRWLRRSKPAVTDDIRKPDATDTAYARIALRAAVSLRRGGAETLGRLGAVTAPVRVITSGEDNVVRVGDSAAVVKALGTPTTLRAEHSLHVVPLDNDLPVLVSESLALVDAVEATVGSGADAG